METLSSNKAGYEFCKEICDIFFATYLTLYIKKTLARNVNYTYHVFVFKSKKLDLFLCEDLF